VDQSGDEPLAGAGLTLKQDRRRSAPRLLEAEESADGLADSFDG
jgi:hypothetical protein